jgi:anaphase-promoting complex subunit 4
MELNAFASLAVLQLPSQSRLLASACCPDKDLVILISRLGGKDRMSLWKMQGSKKWEVDVGTEETSAEEIVGIAWSPDGKYFIRYYLRLNPIFFRAECSSST